MLKAEESTAAKPAAATFDMERLARFAALTSRKGTLENELKAVKAELEQLEPRIIEDMQDVGMNSVNMQGRTFYVQRTIFAGPNEMGREAVVTGLKAAGLEDYVSETFNAQSFSAFVRSCIAEHDGGDTLAPTEVVQLLPEPLRACTYIGEKFNIRSRKG